LIKLHLKKCIFNKHIDINFNKNTFWQEFCLEIENKDAMKNKYQKLVLSIVLDSIGFIPFIDLLWAPVSAYIMSRMYKGKAGKIAVVIAFVEEALPFLDVIPTFTLMWFYSYVIKTEDTKKTIEV
jgi:hypothetical protein